MRGAYKQTDMSVQITNGTSCIRVVRDGVVRWTFPKRNVILEVENSNLNFRHPSGIYLEQVAFSDVSAPSEANVEALRTAVKNFVIT